jgi:hypothetical protein
LGDGEDLGISGGDASAAHKLVGHRPCYVGWPQIAGLALHLCWRTCVSQGNPEQADPLAGPSPLHILSSLLEEIGHKIVKIRKLVLEVKSSFGVVVLPYCWDEGRKTFERIPEEGGLAPGSCMSQEPWYPMNTNPKT